MTRDEMSKLASGDRVILRRDNGTETAGYVSDRSESYVYVTYDDGANGIVKIEENDRLRKI